MNLETIRKLLHAQFLHMRKCNRIVQSDNFEIAYDLANKEEQSDILLAIAEANKDKLKDFVWGKIKHEGEPFEKLNLRELQKIGQYLKIPYYKQLSKLDIIEKIRKNVAERLEKNCE